MNDKITISYLQKYIKAKDHKPELVKYYFLRLVEEVGELSRLFTKGAPIATEDCVEGTIEEEVWDIIYYALAIANCYDIDMEKWIPIKERISNEKHKNDIVFGQELI